MQWISSAETVLTTDQYVLVGDNPNDGVGVFETVSGGLGTVEFVTASTVKIDGIPNHVYFVEISDDYDDGIVTAARSDAGAFPIAESPEFGDRGFVTTDEFGHAEFTVKTISENWPDGRYEPVEITVSVTGSETELIKLFAAPEKIVTGLKSIAFAFIKGEDGLEGDETNKLKIAAAWISEVIPFISDLRRLGFEVFKAATGCDEVSWMNVTFSLIGLFADIATFGLAGAAIKAAKGTMAAGKLFLREFAINASFDLICRGAMSGFMEIATKEVARADGTSATQPADWVLKAEAYVTALKDWAQTGSDELKIAINSAFRTADDVLLGGIYFEAMETGFRQQLEAIESAAEATP